MTRLIYISVFIMSGMLMTSCANKAALKRFEHVRQHQITYDAVVVPGVPFRDSSWQNTMKLRVYWAKYLYDQGLTKNIIFSGGAIYTPYSECEIMRLYALEMGIPDENIYIDSLAEHSTENVYYGYYLALDNSLDKIALASDPYQTNGLKGFVKKLNRKLNTKIDILPCVIDTVMQKSPLPDYEIDFSKAYKTESYINITESQSMFYRLRGTMGQHIDWKNRPAVRIRDGMADRHSSINK